MTRTTTTKNLSRATAILLLLSLPAARAATREEAEKSYPLAAGGRVSLDNVNGDVAIEAWSRDEVSVKATVTAPTDAALAEVQVSVDATPGAVAIHTRYPRTGGSGSVDYVVKVPAGASLAGIELVNGDVKVSGVSGAVDLQSVNGSVSATDLSGEVKIETVNGAVDATLAKLGSQHVSVESVNGAITIHVPAGADATFDAETISGKIATDLGLEVDRGGYVGSSLQGTLGSGAGKVSVETVNGSISITGK